MAWLRVVSSISKNVQSILFSHKNVTKALHRLVFKELCYGSKVSIRQNETQGTTNYYCFHSAKVMFQPKAFNRQLSSETQQSTSFKFRDGKEYMSHVLGEISNENFSPDQYVDIFKQLSCFEGGMGHMTTHDANLFDSSYRDGVEIQHGVEFDQLLVGLQLHIDDLEISSLAKLVKYLVRLGIPVHNKVLSRIFERLLNKESVLSWHDLQRINVLLDMKMSCAHPDLFSANFILPKINILLSNEAYMQDIKDTATLISMISVFTKSRHIILHCTNMLTKCIYYIHQQISDDQLYQDPSFILETLRLINYIAKHPTKIPNDVFIMYDAIVEKTMNSFFHCAESYPISILSQGMREIKRMCSTHPYFNTILRSHKHQLYSVCLTKCRVELQEKDLDFRRLLKMIIPLYLSLSHQEYQIEPDIKLHVNELDSLILNQIRYADITTLVQLTREYLSIRETCSDRVFKEMLKLFWKYIEKDTNVMAQIHLFTFFYLCRNVHRKEYITNMKYDFVSKISYTFEQHAYSNSLKFVCFFNALQMCSLNAHLPKVMLEKVLTTLPRWDNTHLRTILVALNHNPGVSMRDYHMLYKTITTLLRRRIQENPSFSPAIMIIKQLARRPEGLSEYYNILGILPECFEKMTMCEFRKYFEEFKRICYFDGKLLESLEKFVIRHRTYMKAYDLVHILEYMFHVCHGINNPEFESVCLGKIEKDFDCISVYQQIGTVASLCYNGIFPEKLIHRIFSLEYLQGIDNLLLEQTKSGNIWICGYIQRHLMHLNRTLVLDCPQMQVPWIMENLVNYGNIEPRVQGVQRDRVLKNENMSSRFGKKEPMAKFTTGILPLDIFRMKVEKMITTILGDGCYKRNTTLSYHYRADFEIYLDDEGNPLLHEIGVQSWKSNHNIQRIAVLLLSETAFCFNSRRLKGSFTGKTRHLQIMGIKVVHIPHYEWNSMAISATESKEKYLRDKIFSAP